jgi:hypothetical protein
MTLVVEDKARKPILTIQKKKERKQLLEQKNQPKNPRTKLDLLYRK